MAKKDKEPKIKLRHPDRSIAPPETTLLHLAQDKNLFEQADLRQQQLDDENKLHRRRRRQQQQQRQEGASSSADEEEEEEEVSLSPGAERFLEACLWTFSLATLHLSFDVLVQHQYGTEILWGQVARRTVTAWLVFLTLFWTLHPHRSNPILLPGLPQTYQAPLRQAIFFLMSVLCGCYLIHITNRFGYLNIMKRAPPLGCLWLWAVIELSLPWAVLSVAVAGGFLWYGGYEIK